MTKEQIIEVLSMVSEHMVNVPLKVKEKIADELLNLAKAEQPTDEDIEKWAKDEYNEDYFAYKLALRFSIEGAKAMRDGLIKKQ